MSDPDLLDGIPHVLKLQDELVLLAPLEFPVALFRVTQHFLLCGHLGAVDLDVDVGTCPSASHVRRVCCDLVRHAWK